MIFKIIVNISNQRGMHFKRVLCSQMIIFCVSIMLCLYIVSFSFFQRWYAGEMVARSLVVREVSGSNPGRMNAFFFFLRN